MNRKSRPVWQLLLETSSQKSADLTCDECFSIFEYFFDLGQALPVKRTNLLKIIREHLASCPDCRQHYEAKLAKMARIQGK